MVFFNYTTMQVTAKIVYYGPGLCGKTTNLQTIHNKTAPQSRGEMVSLETETDRTLFFDLLPLEVGVIGGMRVRLQLYTVPGQVFYNATRKLVLKGVDGVVFVADSQVAAIETNLESLSNLRQNLAELGLTDLPLVFQYNKRDLRNIHTVEKLNEQLNPEGRPSFEAAALHGIGVFETLKEVSRLSITAMRKKVEAEEPRRASPPPSPPAAAPEPAAAQPAPSALPPEPADVVPVEFAEEDTGHHRVRPVRTRLRRDIHDELEKLRAITTAAPPRTQPGVGVGPSGIERRLKHLLSEPMPVVDVRRKTSVEIPAALLRRVGTLKLMLAFEGDDQPPREGVVVRIERNPRLERMSLHIELDLKAKG